MTLGKSLLASVYPSCSPKPPSPPEIYRATAKLHPHPVSAPSLSIFAPESLQISEWKSCLFTVSFLPRAKTQGFFEARTHPMSSASLKHTHTQTHTLAEDPSPAAFILPPAPIACSSRSPCQNIPPETSRWEMSFWIHY